LFRTVTDLAVHTRELR